MERKLRLHLSDCPHCRNEYEKHLVLAEIDPAGLSAEERIGRGLGVRPRPIALGWPMFASAAAACAVALLVAIPLMRERSAGLDEREFASRGVAPATDGFVVYKVRAGEGPERAPRRMRSDDELAFAYTNPSGFAYFLVFGVDSKGDVHWYHPEWSDADKAPHAVAIAKGADIHELPEAIGQKLERGALRLYAVFTNEPLGVREIEGSLASEKPGHPSLELPGVLVREWQIEVE